MSHWIISCFFFEIISKTFRKLFENLFESEIFEVFRRFFPPVLFAPIEFHLGATSSKMLFRQSEAYITLRPDGSACCYRSEAESLRSDSNFRWKHACALLCANVVRSRRDRTTFKHTTNFLLLIKKFANSSGR